MGGIFKKNFVSFKAIPFSEYSDMTSLMKKW